MRGTMSPCSARAIRSSTAPMRICMSASPTKYTCEVIPGITAMSGCWTRAAMPMTCGDEMLAVLPGTMDEDALADAARRLAMPPSS